jgi:DNA-binding transcriptional ArsR family regulator
MAEADKSQPVFRALADPTRRAIISMLAERPRSIGEVAGAFDVTRNAIVKHLAILSEGGLIEVEAKGRERINHLKPEALKSAADWLNYFDQYWDARLAALKSIVEERK